MTESERWWSVPSSLLYDSGRLDAKYFNRRGLQAYETIEAIRAAGTTIRPLRDDATVWDPARFARVWATEDEPSIGYLAPYDVFEYLPLATERLSVRRNASIEDLQIKSGQILQTCSGRNLGPLSYADDYLASFALSHDMIRIEIPVEIDRYYVYAFLQTSLGQSLLTRDSSGSVISHLTVPDVEAIPIPHFDASLKATVSKLIEASISSRQLARQQLTSCLMELEEELPSGGARGREIWTISAMELTDRLDAVPRSPRLAELRSQVERNGGVRLGAIANPSLPPRYKRYYVESGYGRPIVSGRQVVQAQPVNVKNLSDRSFKDPDKYVLKEGTVVFGADGRAEGLLGWPALVGRQRRGWLANNNIMRLEPVQGVRPGALWLGVACKQVQAQIKATSFGSVVDHTLPNQIVDVIVPPVSDELAAQVEDSWAAFDRSYAENQEAVALLEAALP